MHDIGFSNEEIETYMKLELSQNPTETQRMKMLNEKRNKTLDEIHFREKQLESMDYLRYKIRKEKDD